MSSEPTCTILMLNPVSLAKPSRIFRHGFGEMSKEALKARLCWVVKIVLSNALIEKGEPLEIKLSSCCNLTLVVSVLYVHRFSCGKHLHSSNRLLKRQIMFLMKNKEILLVALRIFSP